MFVSRRYPDDILPIQRFLCLIYAGLGTRCELKILQIEFLDHGTRSERAFGVTGVCKTQHGCMRSATFPGGDLIINFFLGL